ncbi:macro domain-containing protein [Sulfurimonas sp.]|uniref:macro domain-containing protein n=1 Tax=Sulfurimonas sp. TaxID=2022749 RepID=UPI002AB2D9EE|nr:macro domain-containing protein [Sulfurimonas sp.]
MIIYTRTNIFESNAQVLVNTVNTVGVMGKGLAKEFKRIYPDMFDSYQKYCENGIFTIGKLQIYKTSNKWVMNFPTKENWRNASTVEYVELGLQKFVEQYQIQGIKSVSFPMLGCGNGGLDWENVVKPLMYKYLKNLPIDIFIHTAEIDKFTPEHKNQKMIDSWLKNEPSYLSSIEFITNLKQLSSQLINSYSNKKLKLTIEITQEQMGEEDVFCITSKQTKIYITYSVLSNIWQTLKNGGVLQKDMLSQELAQSSDMVMLFLSQLEYITLTQLDNEDVAVRILAFKQPKIINKEEEFFVA